MLGANLRSSRACKNLLDKTKQIHVCLLKRSTHMFIVQCPFRCSKMFLFLCT